MSLRSSTRSWRLGLQRLMIKQFDSMVFLYAHLVRILRIQVTFYMTSKICVGFALLSEVVRLLQRHVVCEENEGPPDTGWGVSGFGINYEDLQAWRLPGQCVLKDHREIEQCVLKDHLGRFVTARGIPFVVYTAAKDLIRRYPACLGERECRLANPTRLPKPVNRTRSNRQ